MPAPEQEIIPVYIPIPIMTIYNIPVLHHYPVNQVIEEQVEVEVPIDVEHQVVVPVEVPVRVE